MGHGREGLPRTGRCGSPWSAHAASPRATAASRPASKRSGRRLVDAGHEVVVYCRAPRASSRDQPDEYLGMQLVHLPAVRHEVAGDAESTPRCPTLHRCGTEVDAAIVFNAANAPFLPLLRARGIPVATHVDGLEWRRSEVEQGAGRRYYRTVEALAVRWSDALIADARGHRRLLPHRVRRADRADRLRCADPGRPAVDRLAELGLEPQGYHLVVARFEPENHVLDGSSRLRRRSEAALPLVVVGSSPYATGLHRRDRGGRRRQRPAARGGLGPGPARPALRERPDATCTATRSAAPTPRCCGRSVPARTSIAYDCIFNREVLNGDGRLLLHAEELAALIEASGAGAGAGRALGSFAREAIRALRLGRRRPPLRGAVRPARRRWPDASSAERSSGRHLERVRHRLGRRRSGVGRRVPGGRHGHLADAAVRPPRPGRRARLTSRRRPGPPQASPSTTARHRSANSRSVKRAS